MSGYILSNGTSISLGRHEVITNCIGDIDDLRDIDQSFLRGIRHIRLGVLERLFQLSGLDQNGFREVLHHPEIIKVLIYAKLKNIELLSKEFNLEDRESPVDIFTSDGYYSFARKGAPELYNKIIFQIQSIFGELSPGEKEEVVKDIDCLGFLGHEGRYIEYSLEFIKYLVQLEGCEFGNFGELKKFIQQDRKIHNLFVYNVTNLDAFKQVFEYLEIKTLDEFKTLLNTPGFVYSIENGFKTFFGLLRRFNIKTLDEAVDFSKEVNGISLYPDIVPLLNECNTNSQVDFYTLINRSDDRWLMMHKGKELVSVAHYFKIPVLDVLDITYHKNSLRHFVGHFVQPYFELLFILNVTTIDELDEVQTKFGNNCFEKVRHEVEKLKEIMRSISARSYKEISKNQFSFLFWSEENSHALENYFSGDQDRVLSFIEEDTSQELVENVGDKQNFQDFMDNIGDLDPKYHSLITASTVIFVLIMNYVKKDKTKLDELIASLNYKDLITPGSGEKAKFILDRFGGDLLQYCQHPIFAELIQKKVTTYSLQTICNKYSVTCFDALVGIFELGIFSSSYNWYALEYILDNFLPSIELFKKYKHVHIFHILISLSEQRVKEVFKYFQVFRMEDILSLKDNQGFISILQVGVDIERVESFLTYFDSMNINDFDNVNNLGDIIENFNIIIANKKILGFPSSGKLSFEDIEKVHLNSVALSVLRRRRKEFRDILIESLQGRVDIMADIELSNDFNPQGDCPDNERHNRPILSGEKANFICVEFRGEVLGHIKLGGDKSFLSYTNFNSEDGELVLIQGGIYTLEDYEEVSAIPVTNSKGNLQVFDISHRQRLRFRFLRMTNIYSFSSVLSDHIDRIGSREIQVVS